MVLAALAPTLKTEFNLTNTDYGKLASAFAIAYALASPLLGQLIDRLGLLRGTSLVVGVWSLAGLATGFAGSFGQLLFCRTALGAAEAGGIPATGKAYGTYLLPKERALGAGVGQLGLSLGLVAAPILAAWSLRHNHWQWAFMIAGGAGLLWIPLWWAVNKVFPVPALPTPSQQEKSSLLRDRRLWRLALANFFSMSVYTLWTNWTTLYLVEQHGLAKDVANQNYAWIPPLGGTAGALVGGYLSMRFIQKGTEEVTARKRVFFITAIFALVTAFVPFAPGPAWATCAIALSFFFVAAGSTNLYTIPVDLFGASHAAFAVSTLVFAYGATQAVFSWLFGWLIDTQKSYVPVCLLVAGMPLFAYLLIASIRSDQNIRPS